MTLKRLQSCFLIFLLMFWSESDAEVKTDEDKDPPDHPAGEPDAFFALPSCHQLLQGDKGEFFSPAYLCSNPALWCNWTIQVDPRKRIHLQLEDMTPDDVCQFKQDQIHVDEPVGHPGTHKVLEGCWREAKYTSSSNTLYVVLLIGGWPSQNYRGFNGRYQAFGPPMVYNPQEDEELLLSPEDPSPSMDQIEDTYELVTMGTEAPLERTELEAGEADSEDDADSFPEQPIESTSGTFRSGRGVTQALSRRDPVTVANTPKHPITVDAPGETEGHSEGYSELATYDEESSQVMEPSTSATEPNNPLPSKVELLSDHQGKLNVRNHSVSRLPGDYLFEVAVEVNFTQDLGETWDALSRSLLHSVQTLIHKHFKSELALQSIVPKRIKRLNSGVLYILWLNVDPELGGSWIHKSVHSAVHSLVPSDIGVSGTRKEANIISVSVIDVNECGTHLALCDVNADCVNHFGSYSCTCRPGFKDESHLGSGTICVDLKTSGCSSGLSVETKGVYILFFLLSSLLLLLLVTGSLLFYRHRRGTFLVKSSGCTTAPLSDPNNNQRYQEDYSGPSDLPPPPLPARGPRESWASRREHRRRAPDLPLLRFSSLVPKDGYLERKDSGKI